ncbi:MAG: multidrug transporter [Alphaproteobacteria bacterium]|nr:multidrug transporter [Alphaproteobacteria bacterium]
MLHYGALAGAILIGVAGQMLLKAGADGAAGVVDQFLRPLTILGLGAYGLAALLYVFALGRIPVSIAFPSVSLSYVVVALLGHFIWHEPMTWQHVLALAMICGGVTLLVRA